MAATASTSAARPVKKHASTATMPISSNNTAGHTEEDGHVSSRASSSEPLEQQHYFIQLRLQHEKLSQDYLG